MSVKFGKYRYFKSKLNDLYLEIKDGVDEPGIVVVTAEKRAGGDTDCQIWYEDPLTGTIRSKLNEYCLDINSRGFLFVNPYKPNKKSQQLVHVNDRIHLKADALQVVVIKDAATGADAECGMEEWGGDDHQRWEAEHKVIEPFWIESEMCGLVLDIASAETGPGGKVITWDKGSTPKTNQLWYEDKKGLIRSCLNDFQFDGSKGTNILMFPDEYDNPGQSWVRSGNKVVSKYNVMRTLDIKKKNKKKGTDIVITDYKGQKNQHWYFVSAVEILQETGMVPGNVDEFGEYDPDWEADPDEVRKSKLGREVVDGKFYKIQSKLNEMCLEVKGMGEGAAVVTAPNKTENAGRQIWYSDLLMGTIRNQMTNLCMDLDDEHTLIVSAHQNGRSEQLWEKTHDRVHMRKDHIMILDIADGAYEAGASVVAAEWSGDDSQRWETIALPMAPFWIVSEFNDLAIDLKQSTKDKVTTHSLMTFDKSPEPVISQMFYEDSSGIIRSCMNDFQIDSSKSSTVQIAVDEFGSQGQEWMWSGNKIVCNKNPKKVLDIKKKEKKKKASIVATDYKEQANQHWKCVIADDLVAKIGMAMRPLPDNSSDEDED